MQADHIYQYRDPQQISYDHLRFIQRANTPGFGIFQPYGKTEHVILSLDRVSLNAEGYRLVHKNSCNPWQDVIDFHAKFQRDYEGPPRALEPSLHKFRQSFMAEEERERVAAEAKGDDAGELDAICDCIYVELGYCRLRGWNFAEAWRRVQEKNMAKRIATPEDIRSGKARHETDILKPEGWAPPDHSDLVAIPEDTRTLATKEIQK